MRDPTCPTQDGGRGEVCRLPKGRRQGHTRARIPGPSPNADREETTPLRMLLLSWNVRYQGLPRRLEAVASAIGSVEPHIVTLQEVYSKSAFDLTNALHGCGLPYVWHSHDPPCRDREVTKPYHCVIASRWPLDTPPAGDAWRSRAPLPELLGRVLVRTAAGDIDVLTVHIPSGAKHGWWKIDTFEVLARALRGAGDTPRILTGDRLRLA